MESPLPRPLHPCTLGVLGSESEECHLSETTTSYWNRELGIPCEVGPQFRSEHAGVA